MADPDRAALLHALGAVSPLDGRYADGTRELAPFFSEGGLIQHRWRVEAAWLRALVAGPLRAHLPPAENGVPPERLEEALESWSQACDERMQLAVKEREAVTRHDVKALEYEMSASLNRLLAAGGEKICQWIHFGCTSEDINNLAYALMMKGARAQVLGPCLGRLANTLVDMAEAHADWPMVARTHGQLASPTTWGKEMAVFAHRLGLAAEEWRRVPIRGKINGATGNFNAHASALPEVDWPQWSADFVASLGLKPTPLTTQIEPHDSVGQFADALARVNTVMLDLARDLWGYIALGYCRQRAVAGEVGSSTMPHKINPIDFENAEGNVGLANALLRHLADKLAVSRWQRDLSDSTAIRSLGAALAYSLLAWNSIGRGLDRIEVDREALARDLQDSWQLLAEPAQTLLKLRGVPGGYEQLKELSRGRPFGAGELRAFIDGLPLDGDDKERLRGLTPLNYTGLAADLAGGVRRRMPAAVLAGDFS